MTGYVVPASIRPPNNLTGDNSSRRSSQPTFSRPTSTERRELNPPDCVIPPAFATNLQRGRQSSWTRRNMEQMSSRRHRPAPFLFLCAHDVVCTSSNVNRFNPPDPMIRFKLSSGEGGDHIEYLVGESADVQDVARSTACVVRFGWIPEHTRRAFGFRFRNSAHWQQSRSTPRP